MGRDSMRVILIFLAAKIRSTSKIAPARCGVENTIVHLFAGPVPGCWESNTNRVAFSGWSSMFSSRTSRPCNSAANRLATTPAPLLFVGQPTGRSGRVVKWTRFQMVAGQILAALTERLRMRIHSTGYPRGARRAPQADYGGSARWFPR